MEETITTKDIVAGLTKLVNEIDLDIHNRLADAIKAYAAASFHKQELGLGGAIGETFYDFDLGVDGRDVHIARFLINLINEGTITVTPDVLQKAVECNPDDVPAAILKTMVAVDAEKLDSHVCWLSKQGFRANDE